MGLKKYETTLTYFLQLQAKATSQSCGGNMSSALYASSGSRLSLLPLMRCSPDVYGTFHKPLNKQKFQDNVSKHISLHVFTLLQHRVMRIGERCEKNHTDSKYGSRFALRAITDYEPLTIRIVTAQFMFTVTDIVVQVDEIPKNSTETTECKTLGGWTA